MYVNPIAEGPQLTMCEPAQQTIYVFQLLHHTGCLLISVACLGIYNLLIFWSLRAEILSTLISKVYKLIHMKEQIKKLFNHH